MGSNMITATKQTRSGRFPYWWQLLCVIVAATLLVSYKLGEWPWDHDEVASLVELGLWSAYAPVTDKSQFTRLPKLLPVWYGTQQVFLAVLPHDELGTRVLSALCGVLTLTFAFCFAALARYAFRRGIGAFGRVQSVLYLAGPAKSLLLDGAVVLYVDFRCDVVADGASRPRDWALRAYQFAGCFEPQSDGSRAGYRLFGVRCTPFFWGPCPRL